MLWADKPGMSEDELLGHLESGEFDRVNRALVYLGSPSAAEPTDRMAEKLVELCSDDDPDVRNEAIYAAGYRWKMPRVLPLLVAIVSGSCEDELILNSAVYAIGELLRTHPDLREQGLQTLSRVALAESIPPRVRNNAYALVAWNAGRISSDQYAKIGIPGAAAVVIDREWLTSMAQASESPP